MRKSSKKWPLLAGIAGSLWWSEAALAQEEVCSPLERTEVVAQMDLADEALAGFDVHEARYQLEMLQSKLRCLTTVVLPSDVARFARLKARMAFFDQDDVEATRWGLLAEEAVPGLPWPADIGPDHPLREMIDAAEPPLPAGPEEAVLVVPRKGGVFLNGHLLREPRAPAELPVLIQVFDKKGVALDAYWQDGGSFREEWLAIGGRAPKVVAPSWWTPEAPAVAEAPAEPGPPAMSDVPAEPVTPTVSDAPGEHTLAPPVEARVPPRCPADRAALREAVGSALHAWRHVDSEELSRRVAITRMDVLCLAEVVSPEVAAEVHLVNGLEASRRQESALAEAAFHGVRATLPGFQLPGILHSDEGVRAAFSAASSAESGVGISLSWGTWFVDGAPDATSVPTERASIVQLQESTGGLRTWYVDGTGVPSALLDRLDLLARERVGPQAARPLTLASSVVPKVAERRRSRTLAMTGLATGVATAGAVAVAVYADDQYDDTGEDGMLLASQAAIGSGVGLVAVTSGLLVAAFVQGEW